MRSVGFEFRQIKSLGPTNVGNRYEGGLVGDSPELMPLDNNLFSDFSKALLDNVVATRHLPKGHASKFSIATPTAAYSAMQKTWEYHPTSERIAQDMRHQSVVSKVNPNPNNPNHNPNLNPTLDSQC